MTTDLNATPPARPRHARRLLPPVLGVVAAATLVAGAAWALRRTEATELRRVPAVEFEQRYRRLARQMLTTQQRTAHEWNVRQLPCEADYRRRYPDSKRMAGTLALRVAIRDGWARVTDVGTTGGSIDQQTAICLHRAWTWLSRPYRVEPDRPDETFWTPWIWRGDVRDRYPPVPPEWQDPERWSHGQPPGWEALAGRLRAHPSSRLAPLTAGSRARALTPGELMASHPLLADELYEAVFSPAAQARRDDIRCPGSPPVSDPAGRADDVLVVNFSVRDGIARVHAPRARSNAGDARYTSCLLRAVGLQAGSYVVPGSPDMDFLVDWPVKVAATR